MLIHLALYQQIPHRQAKKAQHNLSGRCRTDGRERFLHSLSHLPAPPTTRETAYNQSARYHMPRRQRFPLASLYCATQYGLLPFRQMVTFKYITQRRHAYKVFLYCIYLVLALVLNLCGTRHLTSHIKMHKSNKTKTSCFLSRMPALRVTGIEPVSHAWEARVLPLNDTRAFALTARPQFILSGM